MGSCVSLQKDPESTMKLRLSVDSKDEKLPIPSSVKVQPETVNGGDRTIADNAPDRFVHPGSKEEPFFDSQPWLESDTEDDFLSVNGEFTPSRGSTPVHHNFSNGIIRVNKGSLPEGTGGDAREPEPEPEPEPSPPDTKKRLSELFKESLRENVVLEPESTNSTPYVSGANSAASSGSTPNRVPRAEDKSDKSVHCCLPRLKTNRSFSDMRKRMSPSRNVDRQH